MKLHYDNPQPNWTDEDFKSWELELYVDEESIKLWDKMDKENPRLK